MPNEHLLNRFQIDTIEGGASKFKARATNLSVKVSSFILLGGKMYDLFLHVS